MASFKKFIPFVKVDEAKRQVWGIVTAEVPDKENEVCDYEKSKPYYKAVIDEFSKATDGQNFFPLREMHQLSAVGKCVGFEFRDAEREIYMGFEVVDDDAWKKVQKRVYTGFSQGGAIIGDKTPDPKYKGCFRYTASPSEVSVVDNPCLGVCHFAYVKSDGSVEMMKLRSVLDKADKCTCKCDACKNDNCPGCTEGGKMCHAEKVAVGKEKTLTADQFAHVPNEKKPDTWKMRIDSPYHVRKSFVEWSRTKLDVHAAAKAYSRISEAAKSFGMDLTRAQRRIDVLHQHLRKRVRTVVNRDMAKIGNIDPNRFFKLDGELGKLRKGMYEVSELAQVIEQLGYVFYCVVNEQEWEQDEDSKLPDMIADNIDSLVESLLEMAAEETKELQAQVANRL